MNTKPRTFRLPFWVLLVLIAVLILVAFLSLAIGRYEISLKNLFAVFAKWLSTGDASSPDGIVLIHIRLRRLLLAASVGAGLSLSGLTFQSLFSNPLATPDTIGVSAGASFGAALGILFRWNAIGVQALSFAFGLIAAMLTWLTGSRRKGENNLNSMILAGIMIGALFSALLSLVKFSADSETVLPSITYFLMGSLGNASYESIFIGLIPIAIGMLTLFLLRWKMNLLPLPEDDVRAMGVNLKLLRIATTIASTLITSSCVALCGQVGWVGLLVPHMARMIWKNNHITLFPAVTLLGAVFLILIDLLARSMTASEIPVSVLTAILGAPFFIFLMRKEGGWKL